MQSETFLYANTLTRSCMIFSDAENNFHKLMQDVETMPRHDNENLKIDEKLLITRLLTRF